MLSVLLTLPNIAVISEDIGKKRILSTEQDRDKTVNRAVVVYQRLQMLRHGGNICKRLPMNTVNMIELLYKKIVELYRMP